MANIEERLLEVGYDNFEWHEKNQLVQLLSRKYTLPLNHVTDELILNHHKEIKILSLNDKCEQSIIEGFTATNGHHYRTNRDDQMNMIGQKDELLEDETILTVDWKTEDVGYVEHTRSEWLTVYKEAFTHKKTQLFKYNTLKDQANQALTHQDLLNIVW